MEDIALLDAIERYLTLEMSGEEKAAFEELRTKNPDVDQLVVEHQLFMQRFNQFAGQRELKARLNDIHNQLLSSGEISQEISAVKKPATIISIWNKYKRTVAVAASIAGITALTISGMMSYFTPKDNVQITQALGRIFSDVNTVKQKQQEQDEKLNDLIDKNNPSKPTTSPVTGGSSFLIDAKGYLVTNSHVIKNATTLTVENTNGKPYLAKCVYNDPVNDIALLKITDKDFEPLSSLPYGIRRTTADLGEEIFTLGYPRNLIVYGKGYLSAQSGFNDDTLSVQISVDANPGNSGGPVLDRNGDVIGILNSRQENANGVVFANKASNIVKALNRLKEGDSTYQGIKLPIVSALKGKERTQQVSQVKDCVFMVKGFVK